MKERIRHRAKEMFDEGPVEEVEMLFAQGYSPDIPALLNFTYRPEVRLLQGKGFSGRGSRRNSTGHFSIFEDPNKLVQESPCNMDRRRGKISFCFGRGNL